MARVSRDASGAAEISSEFKGKSKIPERVGAREADRAHGVRRGPARIGSSDVSGVVVDIAVATGAAGNRVSPTSGHSKREWKV